jgi:GPH family glycoside/pentoside/hexuronide:cation symporter
VLLYGAIVVGTGLMIGADLALPSAINGDLIEWDALENGRRRPGLFFALWGTHRNWPMPWPWD